jgi:hypothetical protein
MEIVLAQGTYFGLCMGFAEDLWEKSKVSWRLFDARTELETR